VAALAVLMWLAWSAPGFGIPPEPTTTTSLMLFAGTTEGPFRSRDWGGTWEPIERASDGDDSDGWGATFAFHPIGPMVLMGCEDGLFVSMDFGETWERRALEAEVRSLVPSRYPQADLTLFVGTPEGLVRSEDLGRTFRETPIGGTPVGQVVWPGPALVVATGRGVLVSQDGGSSFGSPGEGLPAGEVRAIALSSFFSIDPVLFASTGSLGVFHSSDAGRTWSPAGLDGHEVRDLHWLGPFLYAVAEDGIYRTEDLGEEWVRIDEGLRDVSPVKILFPLAPASGAIVFLAAPQGFYLSNDGGMHWGQLAAPRGEPLCLATFPPPDPEAAKR
jgi:photosystem II stability/assembly factor-like uncharacterized protein